MEDRLRRADPIAWPGFEVVKESTVRTVLRGRVDGVDVHLKVYRAVRLSDRARDALSGSRGVKEMRNLLEARRRGLRCAEPLCAGRSTAGSGSRSFLVTRTIDGARPLPRAPLPAATARAAGELLRAAHDAGLSAPDLHPGNVVEDAAGHLWLLDLHSAVLTEPLDAEERARSLAFFCLALDGGVRDPAAAPLVAGYRAWEALLARAERDGRRQRSHALDAFGRRATRACRHTAVERTQGDDAVTFLHRPAADLHDAARAFVDGPRPQPLKSGRRGAVWLEERIAVKERSAAAARRLFRAAYRLLFAEVPTAQPVALAIRRGRGLVVTRRIDAPCVREELDRGTIDEPALIAGAASLGRSVGRLHALGLRNRDLKLENLVRDPGTGEIALVDLDGLRRKAPLDRRGRARDLGRVLAAWAAVEHPRHARVVRTFWRSYHRALRCLRATPQKDLRRRSEARAREWRHAHRPGPSR